MKQLLSLAAVLLLPLLASAQVFGTITLGTNAVPITTTNSTASSSVNLGGQKNVSLFISGKSASTTNLTTVIFQVKVSPDDVTYYQPDVRYRIPLVLNGTTTATTYTNLDTSGFQYFQIVPIEVPTGGSVSNYLTNVVANFFYK